MEHTRMAYDPLLKSIVRHKHKGTVSDAPHDSQAYVRQNGTWTTVGDAINGDKHHVTELVGNTLTTITIIHNLNKYPSVTVVDTAKTVFTCSIEYTTLNSVVVRTNIVIPSGYIYCN